MADLTKLTDAQIKMSFDALYAKGKEIHDQRKALEDEQRRRQGATRAGVFTRMMGHQNFSSDFFGKVSFRIRIPDGDWIEGNREAEDLKGEAIDLFKNGPMTLNGFLYDVSYDGSYIHVTPHDPKSADAWTNLISAAPNFNRFNTKWSLDTMDIPTQLLRAKA